MSVAESETNSFSFHSKMSNQKKKKNCHWKHEEPLHRRRSDEEHSSENGLLQGNQKTFFRKLCSILQKIQEEMASRKEGQIVTKRQKMICKDRSEVNSNES